MIFCDEIQKLIDMLNDEKYYNYEFDDGNMKLCEIDTGTRFLNFENEEEYYSIRIDTNGNVVFEHEDYELGEFVEGTEGFMRETILDMIEEKFIECSKKLN